MPNPGGRILDMPEIGSPMKICCPFLPYWQPLHLIRAAADKYNTPLMFGSSIRQGAGLSNEQTLLFCQSLVSVCRVACSKDSKGECQVFSRFVSPRLMLGKHSRVRTIFTLCSSKLVAGPHLQRRAGGKALRNECFYIHPHGCCELETSSSHRKHGKGFLPELAWSSNVARLYEVDEDVLTGCQPCQFLSQLSFVPFLYCKACANDVSSENCGKSTLRFCLDPPHTMPVKAVGCPFGPQIFPPKDFQKGRSLLATSAKFGAPPCRLLMPFGSRPFQAVIRTLGSR